MLVVVPLLALWWTVIVWQPGFCSFLHGQGVVGILNCSGSKVKDGMVSGISDALEWQFTKISSIEHKSTELAV